MDIDLYAKAVQLLGRIANSVHDRYLPNDPEMKFSVNEVQVVEQWLKEFVDETLKEKVR